MILDRQFWYTDWFLEKWQKLGFDIETDLAEFETMLLENHEAGVIITGTGGVRKVDGI